MNPPRLGDCKAELSNPSGASIASGSSPNVGITLGRANDSSE